MTAAGRSYAWGEGELADLPTRLLDNVYLEYESPYRDTEVHLFACDPYLLKSGFQHMTQWSCEGDEGCQSVLEYWWLNTQVPSRLPYSVGVPQQPSLVHLDLDQGQFYGLEPPSCPLADMASVRAVRLYQHGLCSYPMSIESLEAQVSNGFWNGFVSDLMSQTGPDLAAREWFHTISYLDHEEGNPLDLRGGFIVDLYYRVEIWEPLFVDNDIWFNANYRFRLGSGKYAGILGVKPAINYGKVEGYGAQDTLDSMTNALTVTLSEQFQQAAASQQLSPPLGPCWGEPACDLVADKFAQAVETGGVNLGLSKPERDQLKAAANATDGDGYVNWRCVSSEAAGEQCRYVLRAKRINVLPDRVELVWFDQKELDNSSYALWVAAHADPETEQAVIAELCAWQQDPYPMLVPGQSYYRTAYARHNAAYAEVVIE